MKLTYNGHLEYCKKKGISPLPRDSWQDLTQEANKYALFAIRAGNVAKLVQGSTYFDQYIGARAQYYLHHIDRYFIQLADLCRIDYDGGMWAGTTLVTPEGMYPVQMQTVINAYNDGLIEINTPQINEHGVYATVKVR